MAAIRTVVFKRPWLRFNMIPAPFIVSLIYPMSHEIVGIRSKWASPMHTGSDFSAQYVARTWQSDRSIHSWADAACPAQWTLGSSPRLFQELIILTCLPSPSKMTCALGERALIVWTDSATAMWLLHLSSALDATINLNQSVRKPICARVWVLSQGLFWLGCWEKIPRNPQSGFVKCPSLVITFGGKMWKTFRQWRGLTKNFDLISTNLKQNLFVRYFQDAQTESDLPKSICYNEWNNCLHRSL